MSSLPGRMNNSKPSLMIQYAHSLKGPWSDQYQPRGDPKLLTFFQKVTRCAPWDWFLPVYENRTDYMRFSSDNGQTWSDGFRFVFTLKEERK